MADHDDLGQTPTGGTGGQSDGPWTVFEQREGLVLSVPYQRLVWLGLLAKHGSYSDYSKAIRALIKSTLKCADCSARLSTFWMCGP
jgi:hypothetical protein